jgi:hypothetical protein
VVKPPALGRRPGFPHWGPAPLSNRAQARTSEGSSQRSTALSIRLSGGWSRATKSSQRASLSVFHEDCAVADPEDGAPSRPKPKQPYSPSKRGGTTDWPLGPFPRAMPPGQRVHNLGRSKGCPRLSSHKFQSHCNVQAHRRG